MTTKITEHPQNLATSTTSDAAKALRLPELIFYGSEGERYDQSGKSYARGEQDRFTNIAWEIVEISSAVQIIYYGNEKKIFIGTNVNAKHLGKDPAREEAYAILTEHNLEKNDVLSAVISHFETIEEAGRNGTFNSAYFILGHNAYDATCDGKNRVSVSKDAPDAYKSDIPIREFIEKLQRPRDMKLLDRTIDGIEKAVDTSKDVVNVSLSDNDAVDSVRVLAQIIQELIRQRPEKPLEGIMSPKWLDQRRADHFGSERPPTVCIHYDGQPLSPQRKRISLDTGEVLQPAPKPDLREPQKRFRLGGLFGSD